jgi:hypothetical protein
MNLRKILAAEFHGGDVSPHDDGGQHHVCLTQETKEG